MPDLSGVPMLDVAIGLAFMFFLLSVVCSSIGEVIAAIFKLRAKNLETGIRAMLGDPELARRFFSDWRIATLSKPKRPRKQTAQKADAPEHGPTVVRGVRSALGWPFKEIRRGGPSYIDPRTAALVLYDTVFPDLAGEGSRDLRRVAREQIDRVGRGNDRLKALLQGVVDQADHEVATVRTHLEDHFNAIMDRATGWYKRRAQVILFLTALAVAAAINADTFNVADRLARDEPLRAQVVQQAVDAASTTAPATTGVPENTAGTPENVRKALRAARATALPLGWTGENVPEDANVGNVALKVLGILVTAFALLLGAPFWFDVLGKFARLRSTGNRIGTPKTDDAAPSDRDDRLKRAAPARPA
jgi:hypothetical protein